MRISSLELSGFKSFHRKTRIEFNSGLNGIVGPNGCGKSNVIDAVRWVIGEQNPRMLRAGCMEDLISDGTVSLKPVGMAEVKLVLSDVPRHGFGDISITRRYYRDGESEYSINGVACRLKDIVDIFMDTGAGARSHSIVGQGEVESFIMAKPEDKRRLIEEVAGIVRYKARKKETVGRLKQTEENLYRIREMSGEARSRREKLRRQAQQAEKLNELTGHAARLELLMLGAQKAKSDRKLSEAKQKISAIDISAREIDTEKNGMATRLRNLEDEAQSLETAISSADSDILAAREKINGEVSSKEIFAGRKDDIEGLIAGLESEKLSLERQARDIKEKIAEARSKAEGSDGKISGLRSEVGIAGGELESFKSGTRVDREGLEEFKNSFFGAVEQCDSTEITYRKLTGEVERVSVRRSYLSEQKDALTEEKRSLSSQRAEFASQLERLKNAQEESGKQKKTIEEDTVSFGEEHKALLADINSLKELRSRSVSRLEELGNIQKSFEWLPESSRRILLEGKGVGVLGVLSDYADVPPEYAKAFEAALGERLSWIVVGTGKDASRAIDRLRRSAEGRATFLPVDSASSTESPSAPAGARPISEVVSLRGEGGDSMRKLLDGICVVDTLSDAFKCAAASPGLSFATLGGDFLDSSGAVTGGWTTGGVFQRKSEIDRLAAEVAALDKKIKSALEKSGSFEVRMEDFKSKMSVLEERIQTDRVKLGAIERDLKGFNFSLEGKEAQLTELESSGAEADEEFEAKTARLNECRKKLEGLREKRQTLKNRLSGFEQKNSEIEKRESALAENLGNLKIKLSSLEQSRKNALSAVEGFLLREKDIADRIGRVSSEIQNKTDEKARMQTSSEEARQSIEALTGELEKKRESVEQIRENRARVLSDMRGLREGIGGLDKRVEELRAKRSDIQINLRTMENNMEYLSVKMGEITEKSGVEPPGEEEIKVAGFEDTKNEFLNLREKIDKFGLVNLLAPEEYEEVSKQHDFLETQIEDLEKNVSSLRKSIAQIDRESARKFADAFEEMDMKFRELLPTLFKGGEGKLVMTDPDDPIETGVDIVVKPGGKKFQSMSLLSGGEKALSAIAFIISSCLVRPLPFLILDEIDAPLDDSNTGRFAALLREISRGSQALVVTHNKTTIADVDALIGITASKASNSAVVSVDLAEAV